MNLSEHLLHPVFKAVGQVADTNGQRTYAIGGFVRDVLLKRPVDDVDFVVEGSGIEMATEVAKLLNAGEVTVFKNFGTAHFKFRGLDVEFVGARKESYRNDSRKPIVEGGTINDDQLRRDFTVNAMAISMNGPTYGQLEDPFEGLADLGNRILRTPLDPDVTFSDDPLRMMRAIRFATTLSFVIEPDCLRAISRNANRMSILSAERITDEFNKIIMAPVPSVGFKLLFNTGLLDTFFPEMTKLKGVEIINGIGHKDNFYHTLQVLDNVAAMSDNLWLRWAAILHDIAKPPTKRFSDEHGWTFHGHEDLGARMVPKIFERLKLPLDHKMKFVRKMVQLHLRPIALTKDEISDSALRRLLYDAGEDIDELMQLCRADITSKNEDKVSRYLTNYDKVIVRMAEVEEKDHLRNFQPPVSGEEIMQRFGIGPGKEVGIIKNAIKDAILDAVIANDREEAELFMLAKATELGLKPI